ncbi:MAG: DUF294 nucleotidyltransferase-like domain-containing protein [Rhizobiaceae bacterium]
MRQNNGATRLTTLDAVAIDSETTGLDTRKARIVQMAAIAICGGKVASAENRSWLVDPGEPIPAASTVIHGIDDAMVAGKPDFAQAWREIETFRDGRVVVGHSIGFDLAVLEREARLAGLEWEAPRGLCIRMLGQIANPELPDQSLDTLASWLGIEVEGRHTALGDARAAAEIFVALIPKLAERGIRTLAEAERASLALHAASEEHQRAGWAEPVRRPETIRVFGKVDPYAYRHRVRDVMSSPPLVVAETQTVRDAIDLMVERRVSSLFVAADPQGGRALDHYAILTERDVMRALSAEGPAMLDRQVGDLASRPLASIAGEAFLYRAVGRMHRLRIRHLAVRDEGGRLEGVISARDLLRLRAGAAIDLEDEIEAAADAEGLAGAWSRLPAVTDRLMAEEIDSATVAAIISEELRVMSRRAGILAEQSMLADGLGPPPCPYALMVLGSGGRGESLLAADQDNAIVFAEGAPDGPQDRWFAELGERIARILDGAGIPLCKGGVMAKNAAWRGSLDTWKARIADWVSRSSPADLLNVDIFFDQRAVHGDTALAQSLFDHSFASGREQRHFPVLLGERIDQTGSAFTMFGNLRGSNGRLDLKQHGLFPIVAFARAAAIRHDLRHRGTRTRLGAMIEQGIGAPAEIRALLDAHTLILSLMLAQQGRDLAAGLPVSNKIELEALDAFQKRRLKRAITRVEQLPPLLRSLMMA